MFFFPCLYLCMHALKVLMPFCPCFLGICGSVCPVPVSVLVQAPECPHSVVCSFLVLFGFGVMLTAAHAACTVLVWEQSLFCSNVGDSKAVLVRLGATMPLSTEHKPDTPSETQRIQGKRQGEGKIAT